MTSIGDPPPVLVVGAGPTGLTAALELSRLRVPVRIVDRAAEPAQTSRALAVQPRTLELLDARGVGAEMVRRGNPARATTLYAGGRRLGSMQLDRTPSRHNYVLLLPQTETERLLEDQLARQGVTVERGTQLVGLEPVPDGVRAVLRDGHSTLEEVAAAYLIAADGAHSTVRHALGLRFDGRSLPDTFLLGDLHLDADLPADELSIFLAPDGFLAVLPLGGRQFRVIATDPRPRLGGAAADPTPAELQAAYDRTTGLPGRLHDLIWSSRFRVHSRHLSTLRAGNVFLGGDAAHVHSPAGGQGMNTGIQDMVNLCWKLAAVLRGQADPALLDTYEAERLPVIRSLVHGTETATGAIASLPAAAHRLLISFLPLVLGLDAVQRRGTRTLSQVGVTYRGSPLTRDAGRSRSGPLRPGALRPGPLRPGALRPGDRIPDLAVDLLPSTSAAGATPHRLHELLDLAHLTLLVVEPDEAAPDVPGLAALRARRDVVTSYRIRVRGGGTTEDEDRLAARLRRHGGLLLVRPDGHLGAIAPLADPRAVAGWLDHWFPAGGVAAAPHATRGEGIAGAQRIRSGSVGDP